MRTAVTVALVMLAAASPAAWGAGLQIIPISPPQGAVMTVGDSTAVILRTSPGAVCYADVRITGAARLDHKAAERANADGMVSWPEEQISTVGTREVTAYCALNGEHAQKIWTYSVE
jgi:hypothetical protein